MHCVPQSKPGALEECRHCGGNQDGGRDANVDLREEADHQENKKLVDDLEAAAEMEEVD